MYHIVVGCRSYLLVCIEISVDDDLSGNVYPIGYDSMLWYRIVESAVE